MLTHLMSEVSKILVYVAVFKFIDTIIVISEQLSPELQKILDSLTTKQRREYDNSNQNVVLLKMIQYERQKSVNLLKYLFVFIKLPIYCASRLHLRSFFIGIYFLTNQIGNQLGNSLCCNLHNRGFQFWLMQNLMQISRNMIG